MSAQSHEDRTAPIIDAFPLNRGDFVLDVVDGKIAAVEVLYRDEIRDAIRQLVR